MRTRSTSAWGTPGQRAIATAHPDALDALADEFAEGSMLPKVQAACEFARGSGNRAAIGGLADIRAMLDGSAGTIVSVEVPGITYRGG